uniref:Uncharacterized protein n=1 Tax=Anguilla anguilla TaxID=7936 RepID=A0A0E9X7N3_ANGAN
MIISYSKIKSVRYVQILLRIYAGRRSGVYLDSEGKSTEMQLSWQLRNCSTSVELDCGIRFSQNHEIQPNKESCLLFPK